MGMRLRKDMWASTILAIFYWLHKKDTNAHERMKSRVQERKEERKEERKRSHLGWLDTGFLCLDLVRSLKHHL